MNGCSDKRPARAIVTLVTPLPSLGKTTALRVLSRCTDVTKGVVTPAYCLPPNVAVSAYQAELSQGHDAVDVVRRPPWSELV